MPEVENPPFPLITEAMRTGSIDDVKSLFGRHPETRRMRVPGFGTWLHFAAAHGTTRIVKYLVDDGYDVNGLGLEGETPIFCAAERGRDDVVKLLLAEGAVLETGSPGSNPLFASIHGKSLEVVRLLLDQGIDAKAKCSDGWKDMDALAFASLWGEAEIADLIAGHLSDGNAEKKRLLLDAARETAAANVEPPPSHGCCPDLTEED